MNLISIVMIGFLILEAANVVTLYFFPESKFSNGVGVFKAYQKSKADPEIYNFIQYLEGMGQIIQGAGAMVGDNHTIDTGLNT